MEPSRSALSWLRSMFSRRFVPWAGALLLCLAVLSGCAGKQASDGPKTQPEETSPTADTSILLDENAPPFAVRIMAANTTSGSDQSYPHPGPGSRIFQALDPDVVLIQEFQVDGSIDLWVDEIFGEDFAFCLEEVNGLPNGVISRFPILECGEWDDPFMLNRDFPYARIDLPGDRDLWAVSVHFKASSGRTNRNRRANEGRELVERIHDAVPEEDFLTVGGDFNTQNRDEPVLDILRDVVVVEAPFPDDGKGSGGTNSSRRKPYDWVLVDGDLEPFEVAVEVGSKRFEHGLVFDSRIYDQSTLDDDFPPVRKGDSGAAQMQHMAVVRDFHLTGLGTPIVPGDDDDDNGDGDGGDGNGDNDDHNDGGDDDDGGDGGDDDGGGEAFDLSGWVLEQQGKSMRLTFPPGTVMAPGTALVIGRAASRQELETCWGPLPPGTTYLVGADLGDDRNGFPQINGGESYRLLNADGQAVDPSDGRVPREPFDKHTVWHRLDTGETTAETVANSTGNVDPGIFEGQRSGVGHPVITEISDASDFRCELIELFYAP